jgi:hypothetical protein
MLAQSVRRVQPVKRTPKTLAKPADSQESESPLEQGGLGWGLLLSLLGKSLKPG